MLSNLWKSWAGSGGSADASRSNPLLFLDGCDNYDEFLLQQAAETETENDDEVANQLLSQFPPYGSFSSAMTAAAKQQPNALMEESRSEELTAADESGDKEDDFVGPIVWTPEGTEQFLGRKVQVETRADYFMDEADGRLTLASALFVAGPDRIREEEGGGKDNEEDDDEDIVDADDNHEDDDEDDEKRNEYAGSTTRRGGRSRRRTFVRRSSSLSLGAASDQASSIGGATSATAASSASSANTNTSGRTIHVRRLLQTAARRKEGDSSDAEDRHDHQHDANVQEKRKSRNYNNNERTRITNIWETQDEMALWRERPCIPPPPLQRPPSLSPPPSPLSSPEGTRGSPRLSPTTLSPKSRRASYWMPLARQCPLCETSFGLRRRHYCKLCGQVYCHACAAYFIPTSRMTIRTCKTCFARVQSGQLFSLLQQAVTANMHDSDPEKEEQQVVPADDCKERTVQNNAQDPPVATVPSRQDQPFEVDAEEAGEPRRISPRQRVDTSPTRGATVGTYTTRKTSTSKSPPPPKTRTPKPLDPPGDDDHDKETMKKKKEKDVVPKMSAYQHLGWVAANHLERMGRELLSSDAPLLFSSPQTNKDLWVDQIMTLATRCCATVQPNVKSGDLLDIRPYCKIKVIAGGHVSDCAYMSGVVFHKNVSHKGMARELLHPRLLLLRTGMEYSRTENRLSSLDTLREQEDRYMEILVGKIVKLQPDVLLVGRSVSRKAQELLLRANIVLLQHVKASLMGRIARQTGATILSSTDHIMNQFGASVLGKCQRFRLVTFRDDEAWTQRVSTQRNEENSKYSKDTESRVTAMLADESLPNSERQALVASRMLGDVVLDGSEAVRCGLAKRGVASTFVMLEGCPKTLGCTVVLRGASRPALKQVKTVLRFLINVAYNLKLETSYLRERCARLPPTFSAMADGEGPVSSSSLAVDYGQPPHGRKVRPWNGGGGGKSDQTHRSITGQITAFDHQSILITSVWMTGKTQCCPAEVKGICYYSLQDVSLGQFLRDSCFNLQLKCQNPSCKKTVLDHSLSFIHNDGLIRITVERMDDELPAPPGEATTASDGQGNSPIATWSYCVNCAKVVTPLVYISEDTWKFSFGKFLEVYFYNRDAIVNAPAHGCSCPIQTATTLYFGCGKLAARFTYERVRPNSVFVRRNLPFHYNFHRREALYHLERLSIDSSELFVRFDKHIDKVSRDARSLFGSAVNKPEHLQTVLSELNSIGSEVDHAAKTLQEKIVALTNKYHMSSASSAAAALMADAMVDMSDARSTGGGGGAAASIDALFRFPRYSQRYLFLLACAWNERLSAAGQAIAAMKKLADSSQAHSVGGRAEMAQNAGGGDGSTDEIVEGMKRLRQLQEVYSQYDVVDMTIESLSGGGGDQQSAPTPSFFNDFEYHDMNDDDVRKDHEAGVMDQSDKDLDFADEVDADVMASRRRLHLVQHGDPRGGKKTATTMSEVPPKHGLGRSSTGRHGARTSGSSNENSTGQPREISRHQHLSDDLIRHGSIIPPISSYNVPATFEDPKAAGAGGVVGGAGAGAGGGSGANAVTRSKAVTAGGAVKSAISRFFNRGNKEFDPYTVDLGIFMEGRPRLEPGVNGVVVPIIDEQPSTIIAYSLCSTEYRAQFNEFAEMDANSSPPAEGASELDGRGGPSEHTLTGSNTTNTPRVTSMDNEVPSDPGDTQAAVHHGADGPALSMEEGQPNEAANAGEAAPTETNAAGARMENKRDIEHRMLMRNKSHIKHTFRDFDEKGQQVCKFVCTSYWATQFHAVREAFLAPQPPSGSSGGKTGAETPSSSGSPTNAAGDGFDSEQQYIQSLTAAYSWAASGGKSGASFSRTADDRFVLKCISRTELQMFLDCAPAYFEYLTKAFFHGLPTVLCKIVGVYQIGYHNRVTGKRTMEQVAVMQNIFYQRKISKIFDLKGSLRGRFAQHNTSDKDKKESAAQPPRDAQSDVPDSLTPAQRMRREKTRRDPRDTGDDDSQGRSSTSGPHQRNGASEESTDSLIHNLLVPLGQPKEPSVSTLLDGDFLEFTSGRPLPLTDRAKAMFHMSILNDTLFLSIINVLDYSILVGIDEEKMELVVGIIDFMRQYDILKQMERVGKSLPMVVGSEAPTIIQPPLYRNRFTTAMERYFMTVPCKWTTI